MARRSKKFDYGKGKYYFDILNGQSAITISRLNREEAVYAFQNYLKIGKNANWLGLWDGKKFQDTDPLKIS